jgi:hypothetical protein
MGSCPLQLQLPQSLSDMGKHAQYAKRGSSTTTGFLTPPAAADWSLALPVVPNMVATLAVPIPAGADRWGVMAIVVSTNIPVPVNVSTVAALTVTPLVANTNYRAVAAWFSSANNVQVSGWSAPKLFNTFP